MKCKVITDYLYCLHTFNPPWILTVVGVNFPIFNKCWQGKSKTFETEISFIHPWSIRRGTRGIMKFKRKLETIPIRKFRSGIKIYWKIKPLGHWKNWIYISWSRDRQLQKFWNYSSLLEKHCRKEENRNRVVVFGMIFCEGDLSNKWISVWYELITSRLEIDNFSSHWSHITVISVINCITVTLHWFKIYLDRYNFYFETATNFHFVLMVLR